MSFYAHCRSIRGTLLGGVIVINTSRFGQREDAEIRMAQIIKANPGNCVGEICESALYPEIFSHCVGGETQAIGFPCPKCGKVLTIADAREYAKCPLQGIKKTNVKPT